MRKFALSVLLSTALCSCAAIPTVLSAVSGISHTADSVTLKGTVALTIAADAYTGVSTLVTAAVNHGAFDRPTLLRIKALNDQANTLLNGANTGLTVAQRAAQLDGIVSQLHSILGK